MDIAIRTMRADELARAIDYATREGWNPGLHDAACFHAADPGGFLLAEQDGEFLGCIGAVSYAGQYGFIGLFIVDPLWRGKGVGKQLWQAGMARLAGHTIGLDGVPQQQENYRRQGFAEAWQNARYASVAQHSDDYEPAALVPLDQVDFGALCAYDRLTFPAPRDAFLRCWSAMPESAGVAWMEEGKIAGWGVIRRCGDGHKIGPLSADSLPVAQAIYQALCARVPRGEAVFLDVPLPNADALALAEAHDMQKVFATARMYMGPPPAIDLGRLYGITTFELG